MLSNRSRFSRISVVGAAAAATLLFAGSASAAAAPEVSVTPSTGLTDGQEVAVTGSGYVAGVEVGVSECVGGTICSDDTVHTTAAADGSFSVSYSVKKTFEATDWETGETVTVDCAVSQCEVVAWEEEGGPVPVPISFS